MISDIRLQHFRSYEDESFEFGSDVNIIVGPNGIGKTNLLEALLMVTKGKSYRASDGDLIKTGASWGRLDARTNDGHERVLTLADVVPIKKTFQIDDKSYSRLSPTKQIPTILFEPNHLFILHGSPEGRRAYLDDILEQTKGGYTGLIRNYRRVLAQRNALLKQPNVHKQDFFPWDLRLSELGAVMHRSRQRLVDALNGNLAELYRKLSQDNTQISIVYDSLFSPDEYETKLLGMLQTNRTRDIERGFTTFGPHREDMTVLYNNKPATLTASRGEIRTVVLALKTIELHLVKEATQTQPIMLLDDVFSELDASHRTSLVREMHHTQTFITTTDTETNVTGRTIEIRI